MGSRKVSLGGEDQFVLDDVEGLVRGDRKVELLAAARHALGEGQGRRQKLVERVVHLKVHLHPKAADTPHAPPHTHNTTRHTPSSSAQVEDKE